MNKPSTSDLPPFPEDAVEEQYAEESDEEDKTLQIQSLMKKMKDLFLAQIKKKGKRKQSTTFTSGGSPIESTLLRHLRHEESPISPTPVPRATSTPVTEQRSQNSPRRLFVSTPTHPSPLQKQLSGKYNPLSK
ncbi:hypothetical protein O181_097598 [Austropuccinia psidii MF-1]|uniref:Uncharacterized protein n=1 Tax=Austropuccinia psidii MF-1 TaxID=1389203 RepID=A0A9Q3PDB9_9BASI|nr:hypothetical protein [Austropuccinia psidii MF-1]